MEKPWWAKPFKDREELRSALSRVGLSAHICFWLGVGFVVVGTIAGAMNIAIGLEATHWLLLAIAAFVAGMPMWLTWAVALHLLGVEAKSKKEE